MSNPTENLFTKRTRKIARELCGLAYERELSTALQELEAKFQEWHEEKIDAFDLNDAIHKHHNGISRHLWNKYADKPEFILPIQIVNGVIKEEEVPEILMKELRDLLPRYRMI